MKLENVNTVQPLQNEQNNRRATPAKDEMAGNNSKAVMDLEQTMDKGQVETIISHLNEFMKPVRTSVEFELHDKLDDYFVKVINRDTDEIIREIPPEKMLDMYAAMAEYMGFLVDEKI